MKTNDELNAAVARAMGWAEFPGRYWQTGPALVHASKVNFAQSLDAIRQHVLPELERRGLQKRFINALLQIMFEQQQWPKAGVETSWAIFSADPRTLCEAALAVMGGE